MGNLVTDLAKSLRDEAARLDRLAMAADRDNDAWDAADLRAKAMEMRRRARRYEDTHQ